MATLRLLTWNLENFGAPGGGGVESKEEIYESKLAFLVDAIRGIDPDVVALQEIGNQGGFDDLRNRLGAAFLHSFLSTKPGRSPRPIRVGFISKLAMPENEREEIHAFQADRFPPVPALAPPDSAPPEPITHMSRGAVSAVVTAGGQSVRLVTTHLKSKLLSYPRAAGKSSFSPKDEGERTLATFAATGLRNTEAATLRDFVVGKRMSDGAAGLVVLGDLNDVPEAASTQIFLGPEDRDASRPDKDDPIRLFNLAMPIPGPRGIAGDVDLLDVKRRFSRKFNGRGELIDHVLASRNLLGEFDGNKLTGVVGFDVVIETISEQDAGIGPTEREKKERPDHAPVVVTFAL